MVNAKRVSIATSLILLGTTSVILCWGFIFGGFWAGSNRPADPLWTYDRSDDRALAGAADNIFFGRVLKQKETISAHGLPFMDFEVEVLQSLKGSLTGTVSVTQEGGTYPYGGGLHKIEGDTDLQVGASYFFATNEWPEKDSHTLVPEFGDIMLQIPDGTIDQKAILTSKDASELRRRFDAALKNPIRFPYD